MLISVSDNQQQMERLVSFPEGSDRFALDIAVSIFDDHSRLARHMLTVCQINSDVLSKLRALEEDINPEIHRALYDLARKDPKDFLMITPPYIELASLVYKRSLTLNMNLMLTRAFYKDSPAPADYFITETSDRLIALCFMAVIC